MAGLLQYLPGKFGLHKAFRIEDENEVYIKPITNIPDIIATTE